jgi:uncharacterized protein
MRDSGYTSAFVIGELSADAKRKLHALQVAIGELDRVVVAFSGGVDSAFLLKVAADVLSDGVLALTARSASMMQAELEDAVALAHEIGVRHEIIETHELDRAEYVGNGANRCYFCKSELFDAAVLAAKGFDSAVIIDGVNADDGRTHQQGQRAASERGVRHPLAEVGLTKAEVRALSRFLGLRTWEKPQLACLSSRVPHGMHVTPERLARIESLEIALRRLGFFDIRARLVRENEDMVRIELGEGELERAVHADLRGQIVAAAQQAGFRFVTLDLEGFRSGRLNEQTGGLVHLRSLPR